MKLHTLAPHESRMCPVDFEVKRSRSCGVGDWKWFPDHNWLCNTPMIMKLHALAPDKSRICSTFFTDFALPFVLLADFALPFVPPGAKKSSGKFVPNEEGVMMLSAMGFTRDQAIKALKNTVSKYVNVYNDCYAIPCIERSGAYWFCPVYLSFYCQLPTLNFAITFEL